MNPRSWLRSLLSDHSMRFPGGQASRSRSRRMSARLAPRFETLEDRLAPATISISDASATEGNANYRFTDYFVAPDGYGLSHSRVVLVGPDQNVYVANLDSNSVKVFEGGTGRYLRDLSTPTGELGAPWTMTFGPDNRLYVHSANAGPHNVVRFDISDGSYEVFVTAGSGGLGNSHGLTFGPDGNLYVATAPPTGSMGIVKRFHGTTGAYIDDFVSVGSGGLQTPQGVAFGPDGNLYVGSRVTHEVKRYDGQTGAYLGNFVSARSGGMSDPGQLVFRDGYLYVSSHSNTPNTYRYNAATGAFVDVFTTSPTGRGSFGMAFGALGEFYVSLTAETFTPMSSVARFAPSSIAAFTVTLNSPSAVPVTVDYSTASGAALAGSDFIAQSGTLTFAPGETSRTILVSTLDNPLTEPSETFTVNLSNVNGATIADGQGTGTIQDNDVAPTLFISDATASESLDVARFVDVPISSATSPFSVPKSIVKGPDGDYFVISNSTNSVLRYNGTTFAYSGTFVSSGSGGLRNPIDLIFANGDLFVSSADTDSVLRYNGQTGNYIGEFVPSGANGIDRPTDLLVRDGVLYVGARNSHEVQRYNLATGVFIDKFVTSGPGGGVIDPIGLAFGPDGNFYIADRDIDGASQSILRYNGTTGAFIDTFVPAGSGGLTLPAGIRFGPDGNLYVASFLPGTPGSVLRYNGTTGAFIDAFVPAGLGGVGEGTRLLFTGNQMLLCSQTTNQIIRYEAPSWAVFNVTLSGPSAVPVTVSYSTANVTALAGSDFTAVSGTVTFAPGQTTQTILVKTINDSALEPVETFVVNLSNPIGATIADGQATGTITDNDPKFYVVNDAATDQIYRYGPTGASQATTTVGAGNTAPRGAASNVAGDRLWIGDANKNVYVYNPGDSLIGSWTAGSLASNAQVEGIATNGTDLWIVDARQDKVFKYAGAASLLSGTQNAASSFNLASGNNNPKGIVTDGTSIWVVNDGSTDKVFKYTMAGALLGSWTITGAGSTPTGITLDPTGPTTLWIVDSGTDRVYEFAGALSRVSGSQAPSANFALAPGNTNPQDIADPPGASSSSIVTSTTLTSISLNPASPRTPLTFTATVTGGSDGDIVELHDNTSDGAVVATGVLAGGSATLTIPANTLTAGTHELVAVYAGDGLKAPSVSNSILQVIDGRPNIVSIAPFSGPTTGGTVVVITGTNLDGATAVAFGPNSAASFTVNSATQITATAPAAAGTGVVDIVVTTPDGSSTTTGTADDFTYALPAPKLGSMMPNGGEMYARNAYGIQVAGLAGNHSIITQLFVTFDIGVTLDPGAFTLDAGHVDVNTAGSVGPVPQGTNVVGIIAEPDPNSLDANGGFKSYRLRFSGSSTYLNSFDNSATGNGGLGNSFTTLKDGSYTLNINGANVHAGNSVSGTPMVGNASQSFWTMYASHAADDRSVSTTPGDGSSAIGVNSSLIDFAKTNGDGYGGGNLAEYNANFDWNLDGDVRDDVIEFAKRFGAEWSF